MNKTERKRLELQKKMLLILHEISLLSDDYKIINEQFNRISSAISKEKIYQDYLAEKNNRKNHNNYDVVALKVASFLKEKGMPIKTNEIFYYLSKEEQIRISYGNLVNNYLRRMNTDRSINVESVVRGFWQYRK